VRGILIYFSDYHCSHCIANAGGRIMFGCQIWSRALPARLAAGVVLMYGRIGRGVAAYA
jgi:hypothetical protein